MQKIFNKQFKKNLRNDSQEHLYCHHKIFATVLSH